MPLKYENIAQVGERIRSYDFAGRTDCYVEGVVQGISAARGFRAFQIQVDRDLWGGQESEARLGQTVYVPMEVAFMEYEGRIVKLEG